VRNKTNPGVSGATRRLTLPLVLEEGRTPGLTSSLLYLGSAFVVAVTIWASLTEIRELAAAPGQIAPSGSVRLVQHLEGGLVAEIMVSEGEIVQKGAPLVRLQPIAAESDLEQVLSRLGHLSLHRERLTAIIEERVPDWGLDGERNPDAVTEQIEAFNATRAQRAKERESLIARVEQREAEVDSLSKQIESLARQVTIQKDQLAIRKGLLDQGLMSKTVFLEVRRMTERTENELTTASGQHAAARKMLADARIKLLELDTDYRRRLTEERSRIAAEIAEAEHTIKKHRDRVARLFVRAPIEGIVQELIPRAIGEVVSPTGLVAQIVPTNSELVAEVRIAPKDIGHVKVGDPADVKVSTYDPARFGGIDGKVRQISASTFKAENGEPYYKAIIGLSRDHVGRNQEQHHVLPGMVVQADIITGVKSLTRYLLKPVYRSLDTAFTER
jgi:HlyD family secretion protein/adhesin transport system membrane fusion protein